VGAAELTLDAEATGKLDRASTAVAA
jgi:hypothetical protein